MKNKFKLPAVFIFSITVFAFACISGENSKRVTNSNANVAPTAEKQTYKSTGIIKAIDTRTGKVKIDHEDIPGYMSAMEMTEAVSERKLLETVRVGDQVEFEIERTGAKIVITKLTKIGEVTLINGSETYQTNCATCHGAVGEGAKKGIPLISGHALHHSEDEYIEQVNNGKGKKMPAFKDKLTAEQIAAVVKFVRRDLQKDTSDNQTSDDDKHEHQH